MRTLAYIAYLAAALCFALTFFDVVYQGKSLLRFTGQELVTGTTFHQPFRIGPAAVEIGHVSALPAAGIALTALAIAAGLFWMKSRAGGGSALALGAVAGLALLLLHSQIAGGIAPRFPGTEIRYAIAHWCSLVLAWLGTLLSAAALPRKAGKSAP